MAGTIVAGLVVFVCLFPLIERLSFTLRFQVGILFSICIGGTGTTEQHITGQGTKIVHITIDTEVVAVKGIVTRIASYTCFLVQRNLAHTVDGVVGIVHHFRHTVPGTLHHHTATKDTTEVSTLDGVHDTTSIDRYHTILLPVAWVGHFLARNGHNNTITGCATRKYRISIWFRKQCHQFVHRQVGTLGFGSSCIIGGSFIVSASYQALVFQLIVSLLTFWQHLILIIFQLVFNMIVVGAVVGDVQLTVTINESQVAITIQATGMTSTDSNQVTVIDIVDRSGGITINSSSIGKQRTTTRSDVTSGKDGIMDDDTKVIKFRPIAVIVLTLQPIKVCSSHVFACIVRSGTTWRTSTTSDAEVLFGLSMWFYHHLTVFGEDIPATIY